MKNKLIFSVLLAGFMPLFLNAGYATASDMKDDGMMKDDKMMKGDKMMKKHK